MKSRLLVTAISLVLTLAAPLFAAEPAGSTAAPAPVTEFSGTLSADYVTSYVFRGAKIADDSIQPAINLQYGALYGTVWANTPTNRRPNSEIDVTVGGALAGLDAGLTGYTYPGRAQTTWEPYLGYSQEIQWFKASVYAYRDATLNTTTLEGKVAAKLGLFSLEASAGTVRHGYAYWSVGPVVKRQITKALSLSTGVQYTSTDDSAVGKDRWVGRVGVSFGF
jgi:hypothetical protein